MGILVTSTMDRVLRFFLEHPTREAHLRELERTLKISLPWIRKLTSQLAAEGLLLRKRERGLVLLKARRDHERFRALKRSANLFALSESGLVAALTDAYNHPAAIVLFGSFALGEDTEASDIDVVVITPRSLRSDLAAFERRLHRKIRVQELPPKKIEKEFLNTLANGIVLAGYLEVA